MLADTAHRRRPRDLLPAPRYPRAGRPAGRETHPRRPHAEIASVRDQIEAFGPDAVVDNMAMCAADADTALDVIKGERLLVTSSIDVYRAYTYLMRDEVGEPMPIDEDSPVRDERYPVPQRRRTAVHADLREARRRGAVPRARRDRDPAPDGLRRTGRSAARVVHPSPGEAPDESGSRSVRARGYRRRATSATWRAACVSRSSRTQPRARSSTSASVRTHPRRRIGRR